MGMGQDFVDDHIGEMDRWYDEQEEQLARYKKRVKLINAGFTPTQADAILEVIDDL